MIVGVDGSEGSIEALRWAAHEAARRHWPVHVMTCTQLPVSVEAGMVGAGALAGSTMDAIVLEQEHINQRAVDLARSFGLGLEVSGETVLGAAGYALVSASHEEDLVVVGATSHPGRLADVLGSVSTVVAHRAKGPVVVVHGSDRRDDVISRIVVGVDGSAGSDEALLWAAEEALRCGAELVLVHGWVYPYVGARTGVSEPRRHAARRDAHAGSERTEGARGGIVGALPLHHHRGEPRQGAHRRRRRSRPGGRGVRGHGGFAALMLGSVSRTVLQHSPRPVAVIRPVD